MRADVEEQVARRRRRRRAAARRSSGTGAGPPGAARRRGASHSARAHAGHAGQLALGQAEADRALEPADVGEHVAHRVLARRARSTQTRKIAASVIGVRMACGSPAGTGGGKPRERARLGRCRRRARRPGPRPPRSAAPRPARARRAPRRAHGLCPELPGQRRDPGQLGGRTVRVHEVDVIGLRVQRPGALTTTSRPAAARPSGTSRDGQSITSTLRADRRTASASGTVRATIGRRSDPRRPVRAQVGSMSRAAAIALARQSGRGAGAQRLGRSVFSNQ